MAVFLQASKQNRQSEEQKTSKKGRVRKKEKTIKLKRKYEKNKFSKKGRLKKKKKRKVIVF